MNILVFNCGSSSLSFKVYTYTGGRFTVVLSGKAHRVGVIGSEKPFIEFLAGETRESMRVDIPNHGKAAELVFTFLNEKNIAVDSIGHRFVHGGSFFTNSALLDDSVKDTLKSCVPLAPIHNPVSLSVIKVSSMSFPDIPQYVAFDSAFHSTIPYYTYTYALPKDLIKKHNYRKYGFHGLSYAFVSARVSRYLGISSGMSKIVACHLGTGGASVCAIDKGCSVDTSMGYSPLPGLMMSTRSGDLDPMLTIYILYLFGFKIDELNEILSKKSGLLGVSTYSSDIRDIISRLNKENPQAELAFKMYIHRLKKYIGSYIAILHGIDALVFTDDIGFSNANVRQAVCDNMEWCGLVLDQKLNLKTNINEVNSLHASDSKAAILSVKTDEELMIAEEGIWLLLKT
jgi:acetate kinase